MVRNVQPARFGSRENEWLALPHATVPAADEQPELDQHFEGLGRIALRDRRQQHGYFGLLRSDLW
jgi:hypothetical protein